MQLKETQKALNTFAKYVIQQSRTNLTKGKKNASDTLYNSISFKVVADSKGFSVQFYMADYGTFIDKGVSGNKQTRSYKDYKGQTITSPYQYTNKQPPSKLLDKWIVRRGIAPRDEKGRFISRKSISFLIARSIKVKGIKSTSFFQRPMELGLKNFSKDLLENVKEDIIEGLITVK